MKMELQPVENKYQDVDPKSDLGGNVPDAKSIQPPIEGHRLCHAEDKTYKWLVFRNFDQGQRILQD